MQGKGSIGRLVVLAALLAGAPSARAEEHGGQEHGGQEHGGQEHGGQEHGGATTAATAAPAAPSAEAIRQTIRDYVGAVAAAHGGALKIADTVTGQPRSLTLDRVHERVGKTGSNYYSCADMVDTASGDQVDVDFDVADHGGTLDVVDVRIHKVNGQPRYTYDDQDNRIPL